MGLDREDDEGNVVTDRPKMPFAEKVGRFILFPLSWIDNAAKAKKRQRQERADAEEAARQQELNAQKREAELQRKAEAATEQAKLESEKTENLARGEKARYRCQLLYDQFEYKIRDKFPQEKLQRYFEQYMNDEFSVDLIERRGQDLEVMIKGFVGEDKPKTPKSRVEIKAFFDHQRTDANAAGLAPEVLEATHVDINFREDQAMMDFLDTQ